MILAFWLSFLFMDALFSQNQKIPLPSSPMMQTASVASETPDTIADQLSITDVSLVQGHQAAAATGVALGEELPSVDIAKSQSLVEDIRALEFLYNKNPDTKILTSLIQRLATNYQFADANRYLKLLMKQPGYEKLLDVNVILYVLFHADDITVDTSASIQKLLTLIEQYRSTGLLSKNDYHFYRGLLLVRSQKYTEASQRRSSLSMDSRYGSLVQSYEKALAEFSGTQHVPAYYQDALVSVSMLKN